MLNTAHIGLGGRTDQQASHAEGTPNRQLADLEEVLNTPCRGFDGHHRVTASSVYRWFGRPQKVDSINWKEIFALSGQNRLPRPDRLVYLP